MVNKILILIDTILLVIWCLILSYRLKKIEKGKYKMEDEAKLRAFNEEMSKYDGNVMQVNLPPQFSSFKKQDDQSIIKNYVPPPPPTQLGTSSPRCEQCGTLHPPLRPGEICPVAPIKDTKGKEVDLNPFFAQLKNIFLSQISKKNIKNHSKLFQHIVVEITRILENYVEY